FVIQNSEDKKFYFTLKADNHEVILTSETYETKANAEHGIDTVRSNSQDDSKYSRKKSKSGKDYFVLVAGNWEVIGTSEEYSSATAMEDGIKSVKHLAPNADITQK
ncbi:MAG TPA: YegP family protein, partial [Longilinea sp.]|nr:YegP family protein [Longilinea sp.]